MHIKRLEIKNCLGIKELELQAGQVNLIKGANESGKTSILEVIEKALRNTERRTDFIHSGAREGTLYVELDDGLAIDRRIQEGGRSSVKLTRDGEKIPRPESFLRNMVGEYAFNPVDFLGRREREQAELLLGLIPMRISAEQLQEWFQTVPPVSLERHPIELLTYLAEKYFYEMRALANSEARQCRQEAEALFQQLPDNYRGEDWREVEIGALWERVQEAARSNGRRQEAAQVLAGFPAQEEALADRFALQVKRHQEERAKQVAGLREKVLGQKRALEEEIAELEEQLLRLQEGVRRRRDAQETLEKGARLREEGLQKEEQLQVAGVEEALALEMERLQERLERAADYLQEHGKEPVEVGPLEQEARRAEEMKGYLPLYDNMLRLQAGLEDLHARASWLDDCVNLARRLPAELLEGAELPVEGLGLDEKMQLTVDGLPIRNLSTGRQIKLALQIARATAGPLKLICIDRFESLDPLNQELFFAEIEGDGYQYFISTTQLDRDDGGRYITGLSVEARGGGGGDGEAGAGGEGGDNGAGLLPGAAEVAPEAVKRASGRVAPAGREGGGRPDTVS